MGESFDARIERLLKDEGLLSENQQALKMFNNEKAVGGMVPVTRWLFCYKQ